MPSLDDIANQNKLLVVHRSTLAVLLEQQAHLGGIAYAPPGNVNSIREARAAILSIKVTLREWGVEVEDLPTDKPYDPIVPASVADQAGAMLNIVADLASAPVARMKVASFKDSFQIICHQIARLAVDKDLHDRLHDLQFKCYNPITNGAKDFPGNPSFLENLEQYESDLQEIVNSLCDISERASLAASDQAWIKKVEQSAELLRQAIDQLDNKQLARAAFEIGRVIYVSQPQINMRLKETARELPLANLRDTIRTMQIQLSGVDVPPDKLDQIDQGIAALEKLSQNLASLIEEHDKWQQIDLELHLLENNNNLEQQLDQLGWTWPDLHMEIDRLCENRSDRWTESLRQAVSRLDDALVRPSPVSINAFVTFRSHAAKCFYQADKRLKDLCESLRRVDGPLNSVLSIVER